MKTTLLTQPFDSENKHTDLGRILIELLNSDTPAFDQIWIISAFVKQSAIQKLAPHLQESSSRGARIQVFVGIDIEGTSIEALQELLTLKIETRIIHNKGHTRRISWTDSCAFAAS